MSAEEGLLQTSKSQHDDLSFEPYIGPRPFRRDEKDQARFFGRDAESDEIIALITSHRITLVYAQSGAGKTSIFNAQVIPLLEHYGFQVLPIARVQPTSAQISSKDDNNNYVSSQIKNVYIYNALQSLRPEINAQSILDSSLFEFLDKEFRTYEEKDGEMRPQVLIFDQLEELFSPYPDNWIEQQKGFFEQVADSLDNNPLLRVVFIIREDFLAQLDPFVTILPEKLRGRFRLERLGRKEAILAIKSPLGKVLRNGSEDERADIESEINALVSGLLKIYVEVPGGDIRQLEGEFVEPIQLQVVCRRWWHERQEASKRLGNKKSSLEDLGNVDNALQDFYEDVILTASKQTGVHESKIRIWCQEKLITSSGTRSIVHRGQKTTEGINNNVIKWLERKYLIRKERRAGADWYELTHDGLIKPIKNSNAKWKNAKHRKRNRKIITSGLVGAAASIIIIIAIVPFFYPVPLATPSAPTVFIEQRIVSVDQRIVSVGNSPTSVAVDPNTNMVYVANYDSNTTSIINGATNSVVDTVPVGQLPAGVAINPNTNLIYVANWHSNTVSIINGTTNSVVDTVPVGQSSPTSVAVDPNTNMVYVANGDSNTVSIINGTTNSVVGRIDVGNYPTSVAINPTTNTIYVANNDSRTVSVINGTTNSVVHTVPVGQSPAGVAINPTTNTIYVANYDSNTTSIVNGTTNSVVAHITVGNYPTSVAINPTTNTIYVANLGSSTVSVIDGIANTLAAEGIAVGNFPTSVAVNPNTNMTYVANGGDDTLSIIAPTSTKVLPRAYEIDINNQTNLGIAKSNLGECQVAIERFDKIIRLNELRPGELVETPELAASLYNKGLCLEKLGNLTGAEQYKNQAHNVNPNYKGGYVLKSNFSAPALDLGKLIPPP
jgi:YVTN family beta-propeller protein